MTSGELFRFVLFWIASPKARNDGESGKNAEIREEQGKRVPSDASLLCVNEQGGTELNAVIRRRYAFFIRFF